MFPAVRLLFRQSQREFRARGDGVVHARRGQFQRAGFHPALQALLPLWQARELAVLQGVGYPNPNLSHFRSIEIWDSASKSNETLPQGWLTRCFVRQPPPAAFAADALVVGSQDMGPLAGGGRVVALSNSRQFERMARLAGDGGGAGAGPLAPIQRVESDIRHAAVKLAGKGPAFDFRTEFPPGGFGDTVRTACQVLGSGAEVAVMRLTLSGFDTHQDQPGVHGGLLKQLADGLTALRSALIELNRWRRTLVLSYAEFGRRPKEDLSGGSDHGTASARRRRARWPLRRAAQPGSARRQWQHGIRHRLPPTVRACRSP